MGASLDDVLGEVRANRVELGGKLDGVHDRVSKTREELVGLKTLVAQHVGSPLLHPVQPCSRLREHLKKHWAITLLALSALGSGLGALAAVVFS